MKAFELIALLQQVDPDRDVFIETPTHDHWGVMLAVPAGSLEEMPTTLSEYHSEMKIHYTHAHCPAPHDATNLLVLRAEV